MATTKLDYMMLRAIDGTHKSRVEFEEQARLRSLARCGVRVVCDEKGIMRVNWATVPTSDGR